VSALLLAVLLSGAAAAAPLPPPPPAALAETPAAAPPKDMSFDRFVLAVIWQPGVCRSGEPVSKAACRKGRAAGYAARHLTLHGLWADLPEGLRAGGMKKGDWYKYGCYWFRPDHAIPGRMCEDPALPLAPSLRRAMNARMPGRQGCLDRHEYYKHAECYGWKPNAFFKRALALQKKVDRSRFGAFVRGHRGKTVPREALEAAFAGAFRLKDAAALELRCAPDPGARDTGILVQAWITLAAKTADSLPKAEAFLAGRGGDCPARVLIAR
jgi:ribonuclease I